MTEQPTGGGVAERGAVPAFFSPLPQSIFDAQLGGLATVPRLAKSQLDQRAQELSSQVTKRDYSLNPFVVLTGEGKKITEAIKSELESTRADSHELGTKLDRFDQLAEADRGLKARAVTREYADIKQRTVDAWQGEQKMRRITGLPSHIAGTSAGLYEVGQIAQIRAPGIRIDKQATMQALQAKQQAAALNRKVTLEEHLTPSEQEELQAARDEVARFNENEVLPRRTGTSQRRDSRPAGDELARLRARHDAINARNREARQTAPVIAPTPPTQAPDRQPSIPIPPAPDVPPAVSIPAAPSQRTRFTQSTRPDPLPLPAPNVDMPDVDVSTPVPADGDAAAATWITRLSAEDILTGDPLASLTAARAIQRITHAAAPREPVLPPEPPPTPDNPQRIYSVLSNNNLDFCFAICV